MDLSGLEQVVITGCLGGLGSSLVRGVVDQDINVVGVDNFDPGCAPILHHRYVLNELEKNEKFQFHAHDIRNPFPPDLLKENEKRLWLHCVDYAPTRHSYFDGFTAEEILVKGLGRLLNEYNNDHHIVFQHIPIKPDDPRSEDIEWKIVIELNGQQRKSFVSLKNLLFVELPLLCGKHQSAKTIPLKMFLQFNSGIPIEVRDLSNDVLAMDMEKFVSDFSEQIAQNNLQTEISPKNHLRFNQKKTLQFLKEKYPDSEFEVHSQNRALGAPPIGLETSIQEEIPLELLYESISEIPHYPPHEWAKEIKRVEKERRAIRRRKQRRKKNK